MCGSRGGGGGQGVRTPLKNHKNIGFLSNTGPDPLENHKATKPAFNVGPSTAHISLADRKYPAFIGIWILSPLIKTVKKEKRKEETLSELDRWTPLTKLLVRALRDKK